MGLKLVNAHGVDSQAQIEHSKLGPFSTRHLTISSSRDKAMATSCTEQSSLLSGSVLLADDNEYSAQHSRRRLTELGLDVVLAENGEDAVHNYMTSTFVAVLMDCEMPVMDGFTATMRIRNYEQRHGLPPVPIIAMTSCSVAVNPERCFDAGMNEALAKPISPRALSDALRRYLDASSDSWLLEPRMRLRRLA
jgi:CheY-like chemotaxis protein